MTRSIEDQVAPQTSGPSPIADEDLLLNMVWTGDVFGGLRYFTASILHHSGVRLRFVLNGCAPGQREQMEGFVEKWPGRVVEIIEVSPPDEMIAHGVALDRVRGQRDDGDYFAMIDPDILATGPFTPPLKDLLAKHSVVSSGVEVWSTSNLVPAGQPGVAGENFYTADGFVFGGPHFTMYHRDVLDEVCDRWGVGLGSAGPELRDDTLEHLKAAGHEYIVYDTAKIVGALIQADGHSLVHHDVEPISHFGGMSHFLAPPAYVEMDGEIVPDWVPFQNDNVRFEANKIVADVLLAAIAGAPPQPVPRRLGEEIDDKIERFATQVREVVESFRDRV